MLARLKMLWVTVRDSLRFVPGLLTLFAAAFGGGRLEAGKCIPPWARA